MDGLAGVTKQYNEEYKKGLEYQDFISKYFNLCSFSSQKYQYELGENTLGMEIKYDEVLEKNGNIYIETHEKTNKDNNEYVLSGIYREWCWLYLIGNYKLAYIFATKTLKRILELEEQRNKVRLITIPTSKGFLLNLEQANKLCIKKLYF